MADSLRPAGRPALLGGDPACHLAWPTWPTYGEAEERALRETLASGEWWYGKRVRCFEEAYAAFQGARFAVSCTNGTTALEMALRALGVAPGSEVIVPPYTFVATASAVITVGAIPVFADIAPDTLCLDPQDVARKVTPRTRAIIPVHVGGRVADMPSILHIARRYALETIEDAAHAWGSELEGRGAGALGRCGTFSFQVSKNMTAGEGGVLVTDDERLADLCRSYSHCGRVKGAAWYDHDALGSNLRMTEFQAALLLAQLERLPSQMAVREANARLLDDGLSSIPGLRLLAPAPEMTRRSYHMYIFRVCEAELGVSRDRFLAALQAEGVPASEGWYRPLYRNGVFQSATSQTYHPLLAPLAGKGLDYGGTSCPVCEQVCRDAIWIPHHALLAPENNIVRLIGAVQRIVDHAPALSAM